MQGEDKVSNKTRGCKIIHRQSREMAISDNNFMKKVDSGKAINDNQKQKYLSEATVKSSGTLKTTLRGVNVINE
jgi:hypothetical protein